MAAGCLTGIGGLVLIRDAFSANAARDIGTTAGIAALAGFVALLAAAIAHRAYRDPIAGLTLSLVATAFAALAGFLAVPGAPGAPNVLLAAMAAAVTSRAGDADNGLRRCHIDRGVVLRAGHRPWPRSRA